MAGFATILLTADLPFLLSRMHSLWQIGVAAGVLVLYFAVVTLREKWRKYRTRSWPVSTGTIGSIQAKKIDGGVNGVDYWKVSFDYSYRVTQEHSGRYSFNCTSERMSEGAAAGLAGKTVSVRYKPSDESESLLWEDEIWDIWWDTYWSLDHGESEAAAG